MTSKMHLKVAHVPLVERPKFGNLVPTKKEVRVNKVKINKSKKFSQILRK